MQRDISRQLRFVPIPEVEDRDFAERLKASGLLKSEAFVDAVLYSYLMR
jgi:hypothetical protein